MLTLRVWQLRLKDLSEVVRPLTPEFLSRLSSSSRHLAGFSSRKRNRNRVLSTNRLSPQADLNAQLGILILCMWTLLPQVHPLCSGSQTSHSQLSGQLGPPHRRSWRIIMLSEETGSVKLLKRSRLCLYNLLARVRTNFKRYFSAL